MKLKKIQGKEETITFKKRDEGKRPRRIQNKEIESGISENYEE